MAELSEQFSGTDLVLLKISIKEKTKAIQKYSEEFHIGFPILLDDGSVANDYGVWSHPSTFLIDRDGMIVGRAIGPRDWASEATTNYIRELLGRGR